MIILSILILVQVTLLVICSTQPEWSVYKALGKSATAMGPMLKTTSTRGTRSKGTLNDYRSRQGFDISKLQPRALSSLVFVRLLVEMEGPRKESRNFEGQNA